MERHFAGEAGLEADMIAAAPPAMRAAIGRVVKDPEGEMRSLRRILRAWQERFAEIEERVLRMQERDVAQRRSELAAMPLVDFIEKATMAPLVRTAACARSASRPATSPGLQLHLRRGALAPHLLPLAESALDGDPAASPRPCGLPGPRDESRCGSCATSPSETST